MTKLAQQLVEKGIKYLTVDAYYFKQKFVIPVMKNGLYVIGKLKNDADLRWAYTGSYCGRGRPKVYGGKVSLKKEQDRFESVERLDSGEDVYTARVHSKCLNAGFASSCCGFSVEKKQVWPFCFQRIRIWMQ